MSEEYLALPDGAGRFRQDFSGPALLRILLVLSKAGPEKSCLNLPAPSGKAKYFSETDSEPVP